MNLSDTVELMNSSDYKQRFKAEFFQLKIRMEGLYNMLIKYKQNKLSFKPNCSYDLLNAQYRVMDMYRQILVDRAEIEGIELN